ncbi:CoA pyrophosphatase [Rhodococcus spelaei]|uniref:CoA pyrophosphatase n=1 Tax=Rhodococcus spelaei TaxID=2546320 RepID=A0A541B7B5_9NOCA|nr:CoA pyrophosphatase [Rhodococcus spelaei]TQF68219.1 CoA pyrophosphatase [Rhodococcus spelaei]
MDLSTPKPSDEDPGETAPTDAGPALTRDDCAARVAAFDRLVVPDTGGRRAAVALTVITDDAGARLLLTRRPPKMRAHAGQFALPGGSIDPGETPEQAAVRELAEELGVHAPADAVVGALDDYVTRSGFVITPVVLWVGELTEPITPNPDEVALVFEVTMAEVDVDAQLEPVTGAIAGTPPMLRWPFRGGAMHAPTGAIIHQFREVVLHGRATRVAGFSQPDFAAR